jgi:hypothetical protein
MASEFFCTGILKVREGRKVMPYRVPIIIRSAKGTGSEIQLEPHLN